MFPEVSRVGFLHDVSADSKIAALHLQEAETAAQALGYQLLPVAVRDAKDLQRAFATMTEQGADVLLTQLSIFTLYHRKQIVSLAAENRLPAIYQGREFAEAGGLMSYGTNRLDQWRRAAAYVDKILHGAKPADLPVQEPGKLELVVNLRAMRELGIEIPPSILLRADEVIE